MDETTDKGAADVDERHNRPIKKHIDDAHKYPECDQSFENYSGLARHFMDDHENVR